MKRILVAAFTLAACQMTTEEGCPVGMTEIGKAREQACVAAYHEEMARQNGGTVTRCVETGNGMSCTTY